MGTDVRVLIVIIVYKNRHTFILHIAYIVFAMRINRGINIVVNIVMFCMEVEGCCLLLRMMYVYIHASL